LTKSGPRECTSTRSSYLQLSEHHSHQMAIIYRSFCLSPRPMDRSENYPRTSGKSRTVKKDLSSITTLRVGSIACAYPQDSWQWSYGHMKTRTVARGTITYPRKRTKFGAQTQIASCDDQKTKSWTLPRQTCRGFLMSSVSKSIFLNELNIQSREVM